jgi:hypothetical protein
MYVRPPNSSTRLDHRLAIFTMVIVGVVIAFSGTSVQAGMILPWVDESPAFVVDLSGDHCGTMSEPERSVANDQAPSGREESSSRETLVAGLFGTGGGASAPGNSSSGQTSLHLAAMFQFPAIVPQLTCLSRYLSEQALQLPQPPRGELLDPPKSGR